MTASPESLGMVTIAALAAEDKVATDIVAIDVSDTLVITDAFFIASADNERQVSSILEEIEDKLREAGHKPLRREGTREGRWALLDYGELIVHVQHDEPRGHPQRPEHPAARPGRQSRVVAPDPQQVRGPGRP